MKWVERLGGDEQGIGFGLEIVRARDHFIPKHKWDNDIGMDHVWSIK
jgi:hypothetical protein